MGKTNNLSLGRATTVLKYSSNDFEKTLQTHTCIQPYAEPTQGCLEL